MQMEAQVSSSMANKLVSPHVRLFDHQQIECSPHIRVSMGTLETDSADWEAQISPAGLKILILLEGFVKVEDAHRGELSVSGPMLLASVNQQQRIVRRAFLPSRRNRFIIVQIDTYALEHLFDIKHDTLCSIFRISQYGYSVSAFPLVKTMRALCAQITTCQLVGMCRSLYLSGKALELVGLAIDSFNSRGRRLGSSSSSSQIKRLEDALALLRQEMRAPPSLSELAKKVGLNTAKLNAGLRELYGQSAFELLQEIRLTEAHRLLCTGEMTVSDVAFQVGYNAAHLSVAFKKRFGHSPRDLRQVKDYRGPASF